MLIDRPKLKVAQGTNVFGAKYGWSVFQKYGGFFFGRWIPVTGVCHGDKDAAINELKHWSKLHADYMEKCESMRNLFIRENWDGNPVNAPAEYYKARTDV